VPSIQSALPDYPALDRKGSDKTLPQQGLEGQASPTIGISSFLNVGQRVCQ